MLAEHANGKRGRVSVSVSCVCVSPSFSSDFDRPADWFIWASRLSWHCLAPPRPVLSCLALSALVLSLSLFLSQSLYICKHRTQTHNMSNHARDNHNTANTDTSSAMLTIQYCINATVLRTIMPSARPHDMPHTIPHTYINTI